MCTHTYMCTWIFYKRRNVYEDSRKFSQDKVLGSVVEYLFSMHTVLSDDASTTETDCQVLALSLQRLLNEVVWELGFTLSEIALGRRRL